MNPTPPEVPLVERQPYEKPALNSISLVADEVLGVGCKADYTVPAQFSGAGCVASLCFADGS